MDLNEQLRRVAELRNSQSNLLSEKKAKLEQWQTENGVLLQSIAETGSALELAEASLRANAVEGYKADGNKAPCPGLAIKLFTRLEYDSKQAFEWALGHKVALKLDTSTFEKIAKAAPETKPEFVTIREEPQCQIATDLTKVLNDTPA